MIAQQQQQQTTLMTQPQAAGREPPDGYILLGAMSYREAGDLVWTVAGWIVCNVTTGMHPAGGLYCRKRGMGMAGAVTGPKSHAPLKMHKEPEWLRTCTPLFYICFTPFQDSDELDVFQAHQLRQAIEKIRDPNNSWCSLYVAYLDAEGEYDQHALMWITYEDDPKDSKAEKIRTINDPFHVYCF